MAREGPRRDVEPRGHTQCPPGPHPGERAGPGAPQRTTRRRPTRPSGTSILAALDRIAWDQLDVARQLDLLRVYEVVLNRFGRPDESTANRLIARFDPHYPSRVRELNAELCQLLVYLQAPDAAAKTVALLAQAPTQEEQIHYAQALRTLKSGWTPALRQAYFTWIARSGQFKGGNSLRGFMANIRRSAIANLSDSEKAALKPILDAKPVTAAPSASTADRPLVKEWTLDELAPALETGLKDRDYDRGRVLFAAAKCFACHRYNDEGGGLGPDLSGVAGRFSARDLLESIVVPSKTISDQYESVTVATTDGRVITGRIVNLNGDNLMINPDMLDPNNMVERSAQPDRGNQALARLDDARGAVEHAEEGRDPRPVRLPPLARRPPEPDVSPWK